MDDELRKCHDDHGGVIETLKMLGQYVFDLPSDVISAMKSSVPSVLEEQTLGLVSFFERFLFPNLPSIPADVRNPIVHHGLRYNLRKVNRRREARIFVQEDQLYSLFVRW